MIDAHCHLQDERFAADIGAVLERAQAAGVTRMVCNGTGESDWPRVAELAATYPAIVPAFGLHPWFVRERSADWLARLRGWLEAWPGAPCGEAGLDHALPERNDDEQRAVFLAQAALAAELGRPLIVHCRRAWGALQAEADVLGRLPRGFMIHAYSGGVELIAPLAALGARFSFAGGVTRTNNRRGREAAAAVPPDRLLIETDAPDMLPDMQGAEPPGGRNEPAYLGRVGAAVAALRGCSAPAVAALTAGNAERFLGV